MKQTIRAEVNGENAVRGLVVLLICFMTIYAPIELSRVIVVWGLAPEFILELAFMWLLYSLAVFIISLVARRHVKQNKEE